MTPKQKAQYLVQSMTFTCRECDYEAKAIQCALIAVYQIIEANPIIFRLDNTIMSNKNYWQEVKQEIEAL
jgi:hypothetical protein